MWSGWVDRFLSWGVLATIAAVALVGLALLTTIEHPAANAPPAQRVSVVMAKPIDSALPSVELRRAAERKTACGDSLDAGRPSTCPPAK